MMEVLTSVSLNVLKLLINNNMVLNTQMGRAVIMERDNYSFEGSEILWSDGSRVPLSISLVDLEYDFQVLFANGGYNLQSEILLADMEMPLPEVPLPLFLLKKAQSVGAIKYNWCKHPYGLDVEMDFDLSFSKYQKKLMLSLAKTYLRPSSSKLSYPLHGLNSMNVSEKMIANFSSIVTNNQRQGAYFIIDNVASAFYPHAYDLYDVWSKFSKEVDDTYDYEFHDVVAYQSYGSRVFLADLSHSYEDLARMGPPGDWYAACNSYPLKKNIFEPDWAYDLGCWFPEQFMLSRVMLGMKFETFKDKITGYLLKHMKKRYLHMVFKKVKRLCKMS